MSCTMYTNYKIDSSRLEGKVQSVMLHKHDWNGLLHNNHVIASLSIVDVVLNWYEIRLTQLSIGA